MFLRNEDSYYSFYILFPFNVVDRISLSSKKMCNCGFWSGENGECVSRVSPQMRLSLYDTKVFESGKNGSYFVLLSLELVFKLNSPFFLFNWWKSTN